MNEKFQKLITLLHEVSTNKEAKDIVEQDIDKAFQESINISLNQIKESLGHWMKDNAEKLSKDFYNVAPYENYDKLLENSEQISEFFKNDAYQSKNWKLSCVHPNDIKKNLLTIHFDNISVDDGDSLRGIAIVSDDGQIKHVFAQGE